MLPTYYVNVRWLQSDIVPFCRHLNGRPIMFHPQSYDPGGHTLVSDLSKLSEIGEAEASNLLRQCVTALRRFRRQLQAAMKANGVPLSRSIERVELLNCDEVHKIASTVYIALHLNEDRRWEVDTSVDLSKAVDRRRLALALVVHSFRTVRVHLLNRYPLDGEALQPYYDYSVVVTVYK